MGKVQLLSGLFIVILVSSGVPTAANGAQYIEAQDVVPVVESFSENILLSTRDTPYAHHVEPTLAISDNGTIVAMRRIV